MNILCYGDSNTWGYIPNIDGYSKNSIMQQYPEKDCWWYPLKEKHNVYIDGLCGRTIAHENRWAPNRNSMQTVLEDLKKYPALDLIIIQLGTNDCKSKYNDSARQIVENLESLTKTIQDITHAHLAIISPATIQENNKITQKYYIGANKKSIELDNQYQKLAQEHNYYFISGRKLELGEDGEHLTKNGHKQLSTKVTQCVHYLENLLIINKENL